jgi:hypothetical protein
MSDEYRVRLDEHCRHRGNSTTYEMNLTVSGPDTEDLQRLAISMQCATSPDFRSLNNFAAKDDD